MARALGTYRGERRLQWKEAYRNIEVHSFERARSWSAYTLPSKPLSKRSLARREEWSRKQIEAMKDWVTSIRAKLSKRFVLSNREMATFLMDRDANPSTIDTAKS